MAVEQAWQLSERELYKKFNSSSGGLSENEAAGRLNKFGSNELPEKGKRSIFSIFISQFRNPLIYILIFATIIAFFFGEQVEAGVILLIVLINGLLGFFQEFKSEKALNDLKKFVSFNAVVTRNGEKKDIDSKEITEGDIVSVQIGDKIPADFRILYCEEFQVDESTLTGESFPVEKSSAIVSMENPQASQISNMGFMGTIVTNGHATGIVAAIGEKTFLGKTAVTLSAKIPQTDFESNIRTFGNMLIKVTFLMTAAVFAINAFLGKGILISFLFALALAVGITPEALPIVITIALSAGALELAKQKVIVKKLAVMENLGNMNILCTDKTGTLTENNLVLEKAITIEGTESSELLKKALSCNSVIGKGGRIKISNPFDKAIFEKAEQKLGKIEAEKIIGIKPVEIIDFDYSRRRMSVIIRQESEFLMVSKGAAESILKVCSKKMENGKEVLISKKDEIEISNYEEKGYNVLAIAFKKFSEQKNFASSDEKDLVLAGFLLFSCEPKKTAIHAVLELEKHGVELKILSGDGVLPTQKLCNEIGFKITENKIVTGIELESLNSKQLGEFAEKFNVFCRITPEQKYSIVLALRDKKHVVGFLGDGVNDAPALRASDVGISVNNAVDVAKDAASIILLHKSLESVLTGIKLGRKIFGNITKYILNTVSANFGNMFTVAASSLVLKFIPLLPSQILLNNFLSDIPLLTVSTDKIQQTFLKKPKQWNLKLISQFMVQFGLLSFAFDLLTIVLLIFWLQAPTDAFRTAWFLESVLSEIIITFAIRTQQPFYKSMPSKLLLITSILAAIASIAIIYSTIGKLFEFVALDLTYLLMIATVVTLYFATAELAKQQFFKRHVM